MLRTALLVTTCLALTSFAAPAHSSVIFARDATSIRLQIDGKGRALVSYEQAGKPRHLLAWGAINAGLGLRLDYSGGWGTLGKPLWKRFDNRARPYDGPELAWFVTARKAPDGSYWAVQRWQRLLPNNGRSPANPLARAWELHLSHWRGPLPELSIWLDWIEHGSITHLFGQYRYQGRPIFGSSNTPSGHPLDRYGRNIYLDTFDSPYGPGWKRENSFLTHRATGTFCYGFYPRTGVSGTGDRYRATAIGPGAAPDAYWEAPAGGRYDPSIDDAITLIADEILANDPRCQKR